MKKVILLLCICFVAFCSYGQGIRFETGTWGEVLKKAKKEKKVIFVDVSTSWCEPCRQVATNVFPLKEVGDVYNKQFINYKLDAENGEGPAFCKMYPVKAYPSFFYIDGGGNLVYQFTGSKSADGFLEKVKLIPIFAQYGGYEKMLTAIKDGSASEEVFQIFYTSADLGEKQEILSLHLKSLSGDKLISESYKLLNDMLFYDDAFANRITDMLVSMSNDGRFADGRHDTTFMNDLVLPFQAKMSKFLEESIVQKDIDFFNKLLVINNKFNAFAKVTALGLGYTDVYLSSKRLICATPRYLQMCYWSRNRINPEKFKEEIVGYMDKLMAENSSDSFKAKFASLFRMPILFSALPLEVKDCTYMTSANILCWTDYFWKISPSDERTKALCSKWIRYAFDIQFYNEFIPFQAVDMLAKLGNMKDVISILDESMIIHTLLDHAKMRNELKFKLEDAKNNKL